MSREFFMFSNAVSQQQVKLKPPPHTYLPKSWQGNGARSHLHFALLLLLMLILKWIFFISDVESFALYTILRCFYKNKLQVRASFVIFLLYVSFYTRRCAACVYESLFVCVLFRLKHVSQVIALGWPGTRGFTCFLYIYGFIILSADPQCARLITVMFAKNFVRFLKKMWKFLFRCSPCSPTSFGDFDILGGYCKLLEDVPEVPVTLTC